MQPVDLRTELTVSLAAVADLAPDPKNARRHDERNLAEIARSLQTFGQQKPLVVDAAGVVLAGNGTLEAARRLGWSHVQVVRSALTGEAARQYALADNRTSDLSAWDERVLLEQLRAWDEGQAALAGFTADEVDALESKLKRDAWECGSKEHGGSLRKRFGAPPLTVLDSRAGEWQERKRAWKEAGVNGEGGRDSIPKNTLIATDWMNVAHERTGGSVYDPVLAELAVRWWCPLGGRVLDPCAGSAVRGLVTAACGRQYVGVEIRAEQIAENERVAGLFRLPMPARPRWIQGDSQQLGGVLAAAGEAAPYDMVLTCPPYYDLEPYSDADASAAPTYPQFMAWYRDVFSQAAVHLAPNRFMVLVVGDVRDKRTGAYRGFVADNIVLMRDLGLAFYNDAVLVTPVGSAAIVAGRSFTTTRKVTRVHQNVLVFYKGDPRQVGEHHRGEVEAGEVVAQADVEA